RASNAERFVSSDRRTAVRRRISSTEITSAPASRAARASCRCGRPRRAKRVDHSGQILAAGEAAHDALEFKHRARETTLLAARKAIRSCGTAIRAVHRGEFREALELIAVAAAYLAEADAALDEHPDVRYAGFIHDAKKEFA